MDQEASNSRGGRKIKNIISGSIRIAGKPGIKLMARPAMTNKIGYAILILLASNSINTMIAMSARANGNDSCIDQKYPSYFTEKKARVSYSRLD